ncbi:MAG: DUF3261 domain-containing protein [Treponema sp.]|nr:DUF3261 domain-containing protein [Treponema sp.]
MSNKKTVIILFLCCCSCASKVPVKEDRLYIYLTGSSKYFLLPAVDIENPLDMAQSISAEWQGNGYSFNAWVKADKAGMEMVLLNELGVNMGELSFRDGLVSFSSPLFPKSLKPEYIIADFQLCFYSAGALRQALEDCGLSFENSGSIRRILQGKTVIIEIEKNQNAVRLTNHLRGYTYTLKGSFK